MLAHKAGGKWAGRQRRTRQERLVAAAVEHRSWVVGHAAVDRDITAQAGELLDGADTVSVTAAVATIAATRLGGETHRRGRARCGAAA